MGNDELGEQANFSVNGCQSSRGNALDHNGNSELSQLCDA